MIEDLTIAALTNIATCLCAQISDPDSGVPDVCFCGIVPGDAAVAAYSGDCASACGMAWVRLVNFYPSSAVGVASVQPGNCSVGIGIDVELGIMRCMEVGDPDGSLPTAAEQLAAAELAIRDAAIMHRAVSCCSSIDSKDIIVGQYTPLGPEGGLVGGTIIINVLVG